MGELSMGERSHFKKKHQKNNENITYFKFHWNQTVLSRLKIGGNIYGGPVNGGVTFRSYFFLRKFKKIEKQADE